jgi:hypothetical protein
MGKSTGKNMAISGGAHAPPVLKKGDVLCRNMKDYCGYGKNYPALTDLLFITSYMFSITLFIYIYVS